MDFQTFSSPDNSVSDSEVVRQARRVTWVGFWVNAVLGALKVLAGILGRSQAMIADGVHSFSDFVSDIIVIVFVGISRRKADATYQYGHGKYETLATVILAAMLGVVAVLFFWEGGERTLRALRGDTLASPTWLALGMAVGSIVVKEWLYRYTRKVGVRIKSNVVIANAWHHRSDAFSSLATLAGIAGAMFLGPGWRVLDPLAAMAVSVFIFIVAIEIGKPAILELLEVSLPEDVTKEIWKIISTTPGVKAFHHFASRRNGKLMFVDFHIKVDPDISVRNAHAIASDVEKRLHEKYGSDMVVNIHIEPYAGQEVDSFGRCK